MPLAITFELSEADLDHFRAEMEKAQGRAERMSERSIIAAAARVAAESKKKSVPDFVRDRLQTLGTLIGMLKDREWRLDGKHRVRVVRALCYFAETRDMIPDEVPVLGLLDDAIMVELVARELEPEIEAYTQFCRFREEQASRNRLPPAVLAETLEAERRAMLQRMERRRVRRLRRGGLFGFR